MSTWRPDDRQLGGSALAARLAVIVGRPVGWVPAHTERRADLEAVSP